MTEPSVANRCGECKYRQLEERSPIDDYRCHHPVRHLKELNGSGFHPQLIDDCPKFTPTEPEDRE